MARQEWRGGMDAWMFERWRISAVFVEWFGKSQIFFLSSGDGLRPCDGLLMKLLT